MSQRRKIVADERPARLEKLSGDEWVLVETGTWKSVEQMLRDIWSRDETYRIVLLQSDDPRECVSMGGHCWVEVGGRMVTGETVTVMQRCKHCRATREGTSREPWEWSYPEETR